MPSFFQVPEDAQWLLGDYRCHYRWHGQIHMCGRKQLQHQRPCGSAVCSGWVYTHAHTNVTQASFIRSQGAHVGCKPGSKRRMKALIKPSTSLPVIHLNRLITMTCLWGHCCHWGDGLGQMLDLITFHTLQLVVCWLKRENHSHTLATVSHIHSFSPKVAGWYSKLVPSRRQTQ